MRVLPVSMLVIVGLVVGLVATSHLFLDDKNTSVQPNNTLRKENSATAARAPPIFPKECLPYIVKVEGKGNTTKRLLDIKTHGRFIHDPDMKPAYDHTCFLMKPRYNCAVEPGSKMAQDDQAYMWKFVLQSHPNDSKTLCDISKIVNDLDGPAAIQRDRTVGILGNSYMRQIFEAIACKYGKSHMTRIRLHLHSPDQSLASMAARKGKKFTMEEYGQMATFDPPSLSDAKCFNMSGYLRVPIDDTAEVIPHCGDDIALAEYSEDRNRSISQGNHSMPSLKILYHFRSWWLEDPVAVYRHFLGEKLTQEIDFIAYNQKEAFSSKVPAMRSAQWSDFSNLKSFLESTQRRDAKRWFGANNPWITEIPDGHPCMPGVPDDEAAIFLFLLIFELDGLRQ